MRFSGRGFGLRILLGRTLLIFGGFGGHYVVAFLFVLVLSFPFSTNKLYKSRSSFVHLEGFLVQESFFTDMQPVR